MAVPKFLDIWIQRLGYVPRRIERSLTCAWCGKTFSWEGLTQNNPPLYCSGRHRKSSSEARTRRRVAAEASEKRQKTPKPAPTADELKNVGRCPNPYKITFRTFEEATAVIQRVDPSMHVYKCPCGGLHIGHRSKKRR